MLAYIARRLLFMIPTLLGIMIVNFAVIQVAPGGPIEQLIAKVTGYILDASGSYVPVFFIAAFAYLVALLVIHLLVPKLEPVKLD